ncbi:Gmad2 immunoglobulin-like domain-containing protein [Desulfofundulus thermosubterraneus]|uniref:Immunoglobulin-like domain of spore germination n=1 Tax=Desulfofundulus thermosubterraneus DSM 16057 TaxID=1121432 RepID=A0A1M6HEX4_9FIRM|nr:Gmad2 immunoglobulin-like domain-containing protein [Desulfofundulus thermosubterraneus]SHJ20771.1 Immunoglobulin-like domain of spore germination [Desulfofundulus thermosubterraneus DSM 16057]
MRRSLLLIVSLLLVWGMAGCAVARKPAPPKQPRTVVIPETTRVSFEQTDLAKAPDAVKDVAKALENTDASTWVRAGNDLYLLFSMSPRNREYRAEVTEIRQRNPRADFSWLDVQVRYTRQDTGQAPPNAPVFTVVRVGRLDRPVSGVAFQFNREKGPGPAPMPAAGPQPAVKPAPAESPETAPRVEGEASIDEPAPGQETTSPVKVVGRARHSAGEVRIRLVDEGGTVLSEKTIAVGRESFTDFETSLSYGPPASPKKGFVEIVALTRGKEQSLARVPVTLK